MDEIKLKPCPFCGGKAYIGTLKDGRFPRFFRILRESELLCIARKLLWAEILESWRSR